jgi:chromosome segregation ATPase
MNAFQIMDVLRNRTGLSERDAAGVAEAIVGAVDDRTAVLVTRDQLDARSSELRSDFAALRADFESLRADFETLRADVRTEIAELRAEMRAEIAEMRTEIAGLRTEMRTEIAGLRAEMQTLARTQLSWTVATMIAMTGILLAVIKLG